ncbi:hypothetical protein [Mesorhizobium sp.]|uniref:hypothetical protein n=1 Tax=Mesorhizobium sp. TaxID=1871066 RepID=UPI0011F63F04|nr:hypothetical protein [Mesorhizobium sp.]TIS37543.1 MAG: hypothetical protein E5W95_18195 [Mesorhizobium sp.]
METIPPETGAHLVGNCSSPFIPVILMPLGALIREEILMQPALFVREVRVILDDALVHLVGFGTADGDSQSERSPVSHVVMSNEAFRKLLSDGRSRLAKGGH